MKYKEDFDGIDIKYLFLLLWGRKNIIFFITLFGAVFSVFFALSQNNIYRSTSVLKPVIHQNLQERPNLSNIVNSPLNILSNNNAGGQNLFFTVEKMQNLDFFNNLYEKDKFLIRHQKAHRRLLQEYKIGQNYILVVNIYLKIALYNLQD